MHFAIFFSSVTALCVLSFLGALPLVQSLAAGSMPCLPPCVPTKNEYRNIVTGGVQDGTPFKSEVVGGGGSASYTNGAGTAVTITVGFELKLKLGEVWQAGVSSSVSYTTSKSSAGSASVPCPPGNWHCALMVIPKLHTVTGQVRRVPGQYYCPEPPADEGWQDFSLLAPDVDPNNVATLGVAMCTCKNMLNWADPGHLAQLCPWNC